MNAHPTETDYLLIRQKIWEKFANRLQEWRTNPSRNSFPPLTPPDMTPDVIVISRNNTVIFEPRTPQAAIWLRNRYRLTAETADYEAGILVHPQQQGQLMTELRAAGFSVTE